MYPPPKHHQHEHLEDITKHDWCNALLSDSSVIRLHKRQFPLEESKNAVPNTLFNHTLFTDDAVRAFVSMYRPGSGKRDTGRGDEESAVDRVFEGSNAPQSERRPDVRARHSQNGDSENIDSESLILVSLGRGMDGGIARLHGGVTATLLDHVMGILLSYVFNNTSATKELSVRYKKPIGTPCVLLCRGKIVSRKSRYVETQGWIEDRDGTVFAEGSGGFVLSKAEGESRKAKM